MNRILIFRLLILTLFISSSVLLVGCTKSAQPQIPEVKQGEKAADRNEAKPAEKTPEKVPPKEVVLAVTPGDFFPIVAGSSWEYQGVGNEYASFNRKLLFTSENLAQIREDNGGTVSASVFKITSDAVTRIYFLGEAYEQTNFLNSNPNENIIILKAPLQIGTKWTEPNGTREIIDLNATVDTPAGNFSECLKVKIVNENSTLYEYFKKGVGMVKREFISGDTKVTSSLKKYT